MSESKGKRQPGRRLATAEARTQLPSLVRELAEHERPARSLAERAVEIGPRRAGGTWLVPEVDAQAAIEREQALAQRVADLEDQLEDFAIGVLLEERLARTSGERVSLDELAAELGLSDFLAKERGRQAGAWVGGSSSSPKPATTSTHPAPSREGRSSGCGSRSLRPPTSDAR